MHSMNGNHNENDTNDHAVPLHIYHIFKDSRLTNTQKYFFIVILALDTEQGCPEKLELPVRSLEDFGVKGHGHIRPNLEALKAAGYLLEIGWIQRADGYRVTCITINRQFMHISVKEEQEKKRRRTRRSCITSLS